MTTKARLRRTEAAAALRKLGLRVTPGTLAVMSSYDVGPSFVLNGRHAEYELEDLESFARQKLARKAAKLEAQLAA